MNNIETLNTEDNVVLYYHLIDEDEVGIVVGNKTIYNDETHFLIRGDYQDYAKNFNLFEQIPIGWVEL